MTPDGTAPQQVIRMAVEDAFQEGYRAGMNDGHDLSLKTTEAQHRETKDEIVRAALASPGPTPPEDGSPEYREAIIAATAEAGTVSLDQAVGLSGRFVGALLRHGLRIYPLASPGPRREPPPEPSKEAIQAALDVLWDCQNKSVEPEWYRGTSTLMLKAAYAVDAVGRVPLTEPRLAELLYECPDLWTAGDTDPQDREIYALAAKWLLPRLAEVSVPVSPPTEGPPTDMTRDELLDDALGRPVTPPDAPDAPRDPETHLAHCWHGDGIVLTSYPEQYPETCCHCGARRTRSYRFVTEGHGKFAPSRETEVTYSGGDSPCDPEGASRPGEPQP